MQILVADDDAMFRLIMRSTLTDMGHKVSFAEDGEEAFRMWESQRFHVLITDWMMPKMDGEQLCRAIRADHKRPYTYIVLLTAKTLRAELLSCLKAGADDFMVKPLDRDELTARLHVAERILGLHRELTNLSNLLPICAYCHKIRDEKAPPTPSTDGSPPEPKWTDLESYVAAHTNSSFSHGICPDCYKNVAMKQLDEWMAKRKEGKDGN